MGRDLRRLLPRDRWCVVDKQTWQACRDVLLGRDGTDEELVRAVHIGGSRPDSFTVAERLTSRPMWLAESERDGAAWLRALVARRVVEVPQLAGDRTGQHAATAHIHNQLRRMLELPDITGAPSAETLWNQEIPSVVDRVIGHCLFGDAAIDPGPSLDAIIYSHQLIGGLLDWFAAHYPDGDIATLIRYALAAGLVDPGAKGGIALCPPLDARA